MKQVIYVDVLIIVNLFVNYLVISATSKFLSLKLQKWRLICGEILGGIYSLYILLPPSALIWSLVVKFVMSVSIVFVVFESTNIKIFFKTLICFYLINFAFSGIMLALWSAYKPSGMAINNGTVYFNISPTALLVFATLSYIILKMINRIFGKKSFEKSMCEVKIFSGKKVALLTALIDTGNSLTEPFSGLPVIVAEINSASNVCPESVLTWRKEMKLSEQNNILNSKLRLIPFKTISGEGLLPAFKPEKITINNGPPKEAYVAICEKSALPENFSAIINSDLTN